MKTNFEITAIARGEKIDRPGIYAMPMSWYHDDCCVGPSISSTGLRTIRHYSPGHYWVGSPLNPDREEKEESEEKDAFRMGRAVHHRLLDPAEFATQYITRPTMFDSWRTKAAKEWREEQWSKGITVMSGEEMQRVVGMSDALRGHAIHRDGILDGAIELSIIWKDEKSGVWLKARPDSIPASGAMLADIKITRDARRNHFDRSVREYGYDMQMALGGIGMETVLQRAIEDYVLIPIETTPPFAVTIRPIDENRIYWARLQLRQSINTFATCLRQKEWPTYSQDDGLHIMLDEWEKTRNKEEQNSGYLPKEF